MFIVFIQKSSSMMLIPFELYLSVLEEKGILTGMGMGMGMMMILGGVRLIDVYRFYPKSSSMMPIPFESYISNATFRHGSVVLRFYRSYMRQTEGNNEKNHFSDCVVFFHHMRL